MKKSIKKILASTLIATMAMGSLAGCGGSKTANSGSAAKSNQAAKSAAGTSAKTSSAAAGAIDTSEHVDLKMYLIGERTPDFDEVYDKINEKLNEKVNASLSVDFLSWGEHDTKYSLLFSSQEDFDLIFTASSWCHYEQVAALDGFYPLSEDFIQTYAPDIWKTVPEVAWDQAKINGNIYMVPNYQNEFGADVYAIRGDLMEKYGISDITNWDDIKKFYLACAKDGMYSSAGPWYQYFEAAGMGQAGGTPNNGELILYNSHDPNDLNFYYIGEWDGFSKYCHDAKELADAGAWSKDVLNSTDERQTPFLSGNASCMAWNLGSCKNYAKQMLAEHPEWKPTIVDPAKDQTKEVNPYINNGVAINNASKNKERAMMVLNLLYTDPELQDLTSLGIEGKHWEAVGDDQFKVIDESGYGVDSNCNWGWTNSNIHRTEYIENRTAVDDKFDEILKRWESDIKTPHIYDGFTFDTTNVATQVAAVEAASATYYAPLVNGLVDDVDKSLDEFRSALDSAGIKDIIDELNRQAAEYVASKK